jgi:hypothetical protein
MVPAEHDRLLLQHFDYVERWARARPSEALRAVKDLADGKMRDRLFDLLVGGLRRTGKNTIGLPTATEPVTSLWCAGLASLLRRYVERNGRLSIGTFVICQRSPVQRIEVRRRLNTPPGSCGRAWATSRAMTTTSSGASWTRSTRRTGCPPRPAAPWRG